jgi:hypothetical protein
MPWPIVDLTAMEPAVAAICPSGPGPEEAWACVGAEVGAGSAGAECAFWKRYALWQRGVKVCWQGP